jgi:predicted amidohydrolase
MADEALNRSGRRPDGARRAAPTDGAVKSAALVAVQVHLDASDLTGEARFRARIEADADAAARAADGADHRLFVFPEAIGHFIPLVYAPAAAHRQRTVDAAMAAIAVRRPAALLGGLVRARALVPHAGALQRGLLHALTPAADRLMRRVFAHVARRHRATVVAGSHLRAVGAEIRNTSYTFGPSGQLLATVDKINLVPGLEDSAPGGLGLARGDAHRIPLARTGWANIATLICYDGFSCPHTPHERFAFAGERVDAAGADIIANPAASPWPWHERWVFAPPGPAPTRAEQWQAEGLPSTLARLQRVQYGVTAHLCARIFDKIFEGRSEILARRDGAAAVLAEAKSSDRGEVVCARIPVPVARANAGSATVSRASRAHAD